MSIQFDLFALCQLRRTRNPAELVAKRMPLAPDTLARVSADWGASHQERIGGNQVEYSIGRLLEDGEVFVAQLPKPAWLNTLLNRRNLHDADTLTAADLSSGAVKCLMGVTTTETPEHVLLQLIKPSHIIKPNRWMWFFNEHYQMVDSAGLHLDSGTSISYSIGDERTYFRAFRDLARLFPTQDLIGPATEEQIRNLLSHHSLIAENINATVAQADQFMKRRFAEITASGILDAHSIADFVAAARRNGIALNIQHDRIVVPSEKAACKKLLKFLNEEFMRGPITNTLYDVTSKQLATAT